MEYVNSFGEWDAKGTALITSFEPSSPGTRQLRARASGYCPTDSSVPRYPPRFYYSPSS